MNKEYVTLSLRPARIRRRQDRYREAYGFSKVSADPPIEGVEVRHSVRSFCFGTKTCARGFDQVSGNGCVQLSSPSPDSGTEQFIDRCGKGLFVGDL